MTDLRCGATIRPLRDDDQRSYGWWALGICKTIPSSPDSRYYGLTARRDTSTGHETSEPNFTQRWLIMMELYRNVAASRMQLH